MKLFLLCLILLPATIFGQDNRSEAATSRFFVIGTVNNDGYIYDSIAIKQTEKDTLINQRTFRKIIWQRGISSRNLSVNEVQYEHFSQKRYILLNEALNIIHDIDLISIGPQTGLMYGKTGEISLEFVDTRSYFPRDSLVPDITTPRKYTLSGSSDSHLVVRIDPLVIEQVVSGSRHQNQLIGDLFTKLSEHWNSGATVKFKPEVIPGDEVQLLYRRKNYDDTTGTAEYQNKQYKDLVYAGDTIIEGVSFLQLNENGYGYLSGAEEQPSLNFIRRNDSGVYAGDYLVPYGEYGSLFEIGSKDGDNYIFLQGIDSIRIGDTSFAVIIQYFSNTPYRLYVPSFFPLPYLEAGNVEGIIPYVKLKARAYGHKVQKVLLTDHTHIRKIATSGNAVTITIFVQSPADFEIKIEAGKPFKRRLKQGEQQVIIPFVARKGERYNLEVSYKQKNSSGAMDLSFVGE